MTDHGGAPAGPDPDGPLSARVADFWGGGPVPAAPDVPLEPDPAVAALGQPALVVRGRNCADLVRPAYRAMTSR
ncbi:hypothetical protein [Yinghuangia soli]|uniref:Uncharacterized protein n=1 Tax=Yinghuangia soli TaxID=2908204 RepID=A0AA41U3N4_9ACTN|nr:hypothetical protein [Yinghuangia soli]MCF2532005.1 hypothetical protein [Yinghuangia soli]